MLLLVCVTPTHAAPGDPKLHQAEGLSFVLPEEWAVEPPLAQPSADIAFVATGGPAARIAISRLPQNEAQPRPANPGADPLLSPEFAAERIRLHEGGLVPVEGAASSGNEAGTPVQATSFRCRAPDGSHYVVLITTWHTPTSAVRARLQFREGYPAAAGAQLDAIRSSLRYMGRPTMGFGSFKLAGGPALPNAQAWTALANSPVPSALPKTAVTTRPTPATPTPALPLEQPSVTPDMGSMVQKYRASLIFVEGGGGSGSGFICQTKDGDFLFTNQHVVAPMPTFRLTRLDRTPIPTGAMAGAVGHDIMRFVIAKSEAPLTAMENVDTEARIGDDIVVLGNTEGARVIQPLPGKLVGIGPDRVEVSAEFLPGNSGSPIIHVKTGNVIGIATYLTTGQFTEFRTDRRETVRRFGYRLDSVKLWQPIHWQSFQNERLAMDKVEGLTLDFVGLIREMSGKTAANSTLYKNASLSRAVNDLETQWARRQISAVDRQRAASSLFATIRALSQSDVNQARQTFRYSFFQENLKEHAQIREEMYKLFDQLLKARR
ncbi:MAG: S1 family peptidase [Chthoniobacteraceae bacterium]